MNKSDRIRLQHMRDWTQEAIDISSGKQREDLDTDRMFFNAVIRCVEVIGEAASKISNDFRNRYPAIPWEKIVGMRNRLIHAYFDIQTDIVRKTIAYELPLLRLEIEKILSNLPQNDVQ